MFVFDDNHLVIDGEGEMYDWTSSALPPWYNFKNDIHSLYIGDNITKIGDYAFKDLLRISEVEIWENMLSIGDSAFENCSSLSVAYLPKTLESIGERAFSGCINLSEIQGLIVMIKIFRFECIIIQNLQEDTLKIFFTV